MIGLIMSERILELNRQASDLRHGVLIPGSSEFNSLMQVLKRGEAIPEDLVRDIGASLGVSDLRIRRLYTTWNDLTLDLALLFLETRSEAYVASRYFDFRISEAGLRAVKKGCKFNILHSGTISSTTRTQVFGNLAANPKALRIFRQVLRDPRMSIKEVDFPYSFVVLDSRIVGVEVVDTKGPDTFFIGILFESLQLASKFVEYFNELANKSSEDNRKEMLTSIQRLIADASLGPGPDKSPRN